MTETSSELHSNSNSIRPDRLAVDPASGIPWSPLLRQRRARQVAMHAPAARRLDIKGSSSRRPSHAHHGAATAYMLLPLRRPFPTFLPPAPAPAWPPRKTEGKRQRCCRCIIITASSSTSTSYYATRDTPPAQTPLQTLIVSGGSSVPQYGVRTGIF